MDDPVLPEIGSVFILTKKDSTDFDRNVVSRRLGIIPTKTCPPTVSPGKLLSEIDPAEFQREYSGLTVLPAAAPPYTIIKNAFWCLELPRMHSWDVADPLHRLEELLKGRGSHSPMQGIRSDCGAHFAGLCGVERSAGGGASERKRFLLEQNGRRHSARFISGLKRQREFCPKERFCGKKANGMTFWERLRKNAQSFMRANGFAFKKGIFYRIENDMAFGMNLGMPTGTVYSTALCFHCMCRRSFAIRLMVPD